MPTLAIVLTVFLMAPAFASTVMELGWKDLVPVMEFDDPFEKLTEEQLHHLGIIARVRQLREMGKDSGEVSTRELEAAAETLKNEGVDYEALLARRAEIRELRTMAAEAVVTELDSKEITMGGYLLPLEYVDTKVTEFLLVPWVGACIHTPPPPPNQIVHVVLDEDNAWESNGLFAPVRVTGTIFTQASTRNLFLVDGSSDISIGYTMKARRVEPFGKKG